MTNNNDKNDKIEEFHAKLVDAHHIPRALWSGCKEYRDKFGSYKYEEPSRYNINKDDSVESSVKIEDIEFIIKSGPIFPK